MVKLIRKFASFFFVVSLVAYGGVRAYGLYTSDSSGPDIHMDAQEITVSVADGDSAILEGVTATDADDGDVTASLVVESMSNFITDGVRDATIAAFDSAGNVTKATRRITYSDYTSPTVALSGPLAASTGDSSSLLDVITVTDCLDGDLTSQVQVVFDDNSQSVSAGEFAMHIQVSNSAGDTLDLPVTVRFYSASEEASAPQITLSDYLIYVEQEADVDPVDYLNTITLDYDTYSWDSTENAFVLDREAEDGETEAIYLSSLKIDDSVDTSTPGTYEITYSYTESGSDQTGTVRLVVVVGED